jgi:hypothetical protein
MFIERLTLSNFRCFGPGENVIPLQRELTTFVGLNGTGKTAVMLALQRLFGVTGEQRRLRRQDFHLEAVDVAPIRERTLMLEAVVAFPELSEGGNPATVAEFFQHMAADEGGQLKCRLRLNATWTDDGSVDGAIDSRVYAVRTFGMFSDDDLIELRATDRARIQLIYVPASRDGASQVNAFLRGRLWRAVNWSDRVKQMLAEAGQAINHTFVSEDAVGQVTSALTRRWQELHTAGTDSVPVFRPVDVRLQQFISKVEVVFHPDEAGRERPIEELSDGQRSLLHLAMTAAILDIEARVLADPTSAGFHADGIPLPSLTLIAVEAPFYLSRIVGQLRGLVGGGRAQALMSSHSASILARVDPEEVRYFRIHTHNRTAMVRRIRLPGANEDASKFVREAVRTYPELYFARFVVLGEGASEEVVLPSLSDAMGLPIDRSFVAVVPLGGRHVNHLWRLLRDLEIPFATLLDLDLGRSGGGWGRIRTTVKNLLDTGVYNVSMPDQTEQDPARIAPWLSYLEHFGVFFAFPLDLDYSMLSAFWDEYTALEPGMRGPNSSGAERAVLGEEGNFELYRDANLMAWYRYLFLGRGKPSTHMRVLSGITSQDLARRAPRELRALIEFIRPQLESPGLQGDQ